MHCHCYMSIYFLNWLIIFSFLAVTADWLLPLIFFSFVHVVAVISLCSCIAMAALFIAAFLPLVDCFLFLFLLLPKPDATCTVAQLIDCELSFTSCLLQSMSSHCMHASPLLHCLLLLFCHWVAKAQADTAYIMACCLFASITADS